MASSNSSGPELSREEAVNLGVDCISRTRAIERLKLNFPISQGADNSRDRHRYMQALADIQAIRELPSVTPQAPRKGHWILDETDNSITCDKCGCLIWANDISNGEAYFCPNCGAKMESEDNNAT